MEPIIRELRQGFRPDKFQEVDGGLLVKNVTLLASGTWTDSSVGSPLFYPESTLEKYAENWIDRSVWARHAGKVPRSIIEKIGEVKNPHYSNGGVVGDLFLHGVTQASRDTIELIKAGLVNAVSVEHGGEEIYNKARNRYESSSIIFGGLAIVNRGACSTCVINNEELKIFGGTNMNNDEEQELAAPEHRVRVLKTGEIVGADEIRKNQISIMAEFALRELKEEAENQLAEPRRVRISKLGAISGNGD